jgi:oligopeptidase A
MEPPVSQPAPRPGLDDNPLLDLAAATVSDEAASAGGLPRFRAIRPEHAEPAVDYLLAENRAAIERLVAGAAHYTWENFAEPLEDLNERLGRMWSPVAHLNAVMNNEALRVAYNNCLPKLTEYWTAIGQDVRLYGGYKQIREDPAFERLGAAQRKIVENALRDFRLAGVELPEAEKGRFRAVQQELATLYSKFDENVLDATNAWELLIEDPARLAGLPPRVQEQARQAAAAEGKHGWRFTLHAPSYQPFLRYADERALRRQMYEAYVTRASDQGPQAGRFDNGAVIARILTLRAEAARLLGFANYAEYSLQTKMAKSPRQVLEFLASLAGRCRAVAGREIEELREFARREHGAAELEAWDIPYYSEKLREARYAFREEDLRPYFPEDRVLAGLFEIVRRLYGLEVRRVENPEVWHPDVRFYEIRDIAGAVRGRFYLDLYARAHKRGGAWMDECLSRKRRGARLQLPVAYLCCNFSMPLDGQPALLAHDEVLTLFHEFGHGLHHMLTRVDYAGVAGINGVAWDAVELPSQFMENWCWERAALDLIAGHFETGAPIPPELYDKLIAARNFQAGLQFVRQLEFALFDMRLHSEFDITKSRVSALGSLPSPASGRGNEGEGHERQVANAVQQLLDEVRAEVAVVMPPAFNRFQHGFTHVFAGDGYAAGYYSYKWAEVLSADAFSKFEENGVFDRATGREFMETILEQGGTYEPLELFVRFRGREPQIEPLLRHYGLAA